SDGLCRAKQLWPVRQSAKKRASWPAPCQIRKREHSSWRQVLKKTPEQEGSPKDASRRRFHGRFQWQMRHEYADAREFRREQFLDYAHGDEHESVRCGNARAHASVFPELSKARQSQFQSRESRPGALTR